MQRTPGKFGKKAPVKVVRRDDQMRLSACFAEQVQLLLPMLEPIDIRRCRVAVSGVC